MEDQPTVPTEGSGRAVICLRWYLCVLAFVAPLRFGSVIVSGDIAQYPASIPEWLFGSWPPFLLGALAGLGLLWAAAVCRRSLRTHPARVVLLAWGSLPASCLVGLAVTTEKDAALTFFLYLAGVLAFLVASMKMDLVDPPYRRYLLTAIVAATVLCALAGWHQKLWGFEQMRRFAETQAVQTGEPLSGAMQGKLLQTRVHRPFFLPNSYAAHLALTAPLALLLLWRAGSRVQPAQVSRALFLGVGIILVLGAFWLSRSRGAQLALGAGLGVGVLSLKGLRRWRWPLLALGLLVGVLLMVAVNSGRDLLSASARLQYYQTALKIFAQHPFTGAGLGEFFPWYLRLKPPGAEETRAAHNMVLSLLSQNGILGGLAATVCLAIPLWLALFQKAETRTPDPALMVVTLTGLAAWSAHSLLDFNLEIPPTVLTAAVLPLFCFRLDNRRTTVSAKPCRHREQFLLLLLGVLALAAAWRIPGEKRYRRLSDRAGQASYREISALADAAAAALPWSPYPWVVHGQAALALGRPHAASEAFAGATARSPHRASFHVKEAKALLLTGNPRAAGTPAARAWEWYPLSDQAILVNALVQALETSPVGDPAETVRWSTTALSCRLHLELPRGPGDVVRLVLQPPARGPAVGVSLPELCDRFNALRMTTPFRGLPVRFVAGADGVL